MSVSPTWLAIDVGTTNMRIWRMRGRQMAGSFQQEIGVRDTARTGNATLLIEGLRRGIDELTQAWGEEPRKVPIFAAGMITSALGLVEIPHVQAPAGIDELRARRVEHFEPRLSDCPLHFVPGVRTGQLPCDRTNLSTTDMMRGEETLCVGLMQHSAFQGPGTVLHLSSHWKAIRLDGQRRVAGSTTSLDGEMLLNAHRHTILSSGLPTPDALPECCDDEWTEAGAAAARSDGLMRALFEVRLLESSRATSAVERWSFLVGAFLGQAFDQWTHGAWLDPSNRLWVAGQSALARAAHTLLTRRGFANQWLDSPANRDAWLEGLHAIWHDRIPSER